MFICIYISIYIYIYLFWDKNKAFVFLNRMIPTLALDQSLSRGHRACPQAGAYQLCFAVGRALSPHCNDAQSVTAMQSISLDGQYF